MGVSPIIPMRTFGIFAALAIFVNFIFVITLTPAAIVLWEQGYCCSCCSCCARNKKNDDDKKSPPTKLVEMKKLGHDEVKGESEEEEEELEKKTTTTKSKNGDLEDEFLEKYYLRWLLYKPCAWSVVVVFLAIAGFLVSSAAQLETPREVERWFPKDHMMEKIQEQLREEFLGSSLDAYVDMTYLWGIEGIDRSSFDFFGTNNYRGNPVYTSNFDLFEESSQRSVLEACNTTKTWTCVESGCQSSFGTLALPGTQRCFLKEFRDWHFLRYGVSETYSPFINRTVFMDRLKQFRCNAPALPSNSTCDDASIDTDWSDLIGFVNGELKFVGIEFVSSLQWDTPYATRKDVLQRGDDLRDWMRSNDETNGASLDDAQLSGGHFHAWTVTEGELVNSLFRGFAICFPIAFFVLLFATGNFILSMFAVSTIAMIVGNVLGSVRLFLGWGLGVGEAIAGIIVVGFSVDYVVHLGHMYNESKGDTREQRVRGAAYAMARTVSAGGITTLGAGLMMLPCQVQFFPKMAILIVSTISFSLMYSLGFFMALCTVLGPTGEFGSVSALFRCVRRVVTGSSGGSVVRDSSSSTNNVV